MLNVPLKTVFLALGKRYRLGVWLGQVLCESCVRRSEWL